MSSYTGVLRINIQLFKNAQANIENIENYESLIDDNSYKRRYNEYATQMNNLYKKML